MGEIGRVVIEQLRPQADTKAQRRGSDLRHQLFESVGLVAEPLAERPVQTVRSPRPMDLMPTSA